MHHKDAILDSLAMRGNVAQFVAFRPDSGKARQSHSRIAGHEPNQLYLDTHEAIETLLAASADHSVNVRSYLPSDPRSREFVYGLKSAKEACRTVERLTAEGLHTIVNETVDISDGGVSGVLQGQTLEFSPDDTPRCVEKPGTASMPFEKGMALLEMVYGISTRQSENGPNSASTHGPWVGNRPTPCSGNTNSVLLRLPVAR